VPRAVALFACFLLATVPARAVTFYTSLAGFQNAVVGTQTEDFGSFAAGTLIPDGTSVGPLQLFFGTASGLGGVVTDFYNATSASGMTLAAKQSTGPLDAFDYFFPRDSVGVVGSFLAVGILANVNLDSGDYQLTLSTGDVGTLGSLTYDFGTFVFVGAVSPTPFSAAMFESLSDAFGVFAIAQIVFVPAAIPGPGALGLLGIGLLGLAAATRRGAGRRG
jgi:hypothetical protein